MSLHKEISFEDEICEHLAASGWLFADGDATQYDRERGLFPADLLAWVESSQPKGWAALTTRSRGRRTSSPTSTTPRTRRCSTRSSSSPTAT